METNEQTQAKDERDEFVVTLRFFGVDLDPDEVSRLIGSSPSKAARRGDTRRWSTGSRVESQGSWRLSSEQTSTDIEAQCLALLDRLTADLSVWQSLTARFQADLFCGVFFSRMVGGLAFSPRLHRMLADRNLELVLDIYASDGPIEST